MRTFQLSITIPKNTANMLLSTGFRFHSDATLLFYYRLPHKKPIAT